MNFKLNRLMFFPCTPRLIVPNNNMYDWLLARLFSFRWEMQAANGACVPKTLVPLLGSDWLHHTTCSRIFPESQVVFFLVEVCQLMSFHLLCALHGLSQSTFFDLLGCLRLVYCSKSLFLKRALKIKTMKTFLLAKGSSSSRAFLRNLSNKRRS